MEIQIDPCEKFQISESFSQIGQNKWLWILINGLILDRKTLTEYFTAKHFIIKFSPPIWNQQQRRSHS